MNNSHSFISPKSNATSCKYNTSDFLLWENCFHLPSPDLILFCCCWSYWFYLPLSPLLIFLLISFPSIYWTIHPSHVSTCCHFLAVSYAWLDTFSLASTAALSVASHWPSSFWAHLSCLLMYLQSSFLEESCLPATIGLASPLTP